MRNRVRRSTLYIQCKVFRIDFGSYHFYQFSISKFCPISHGHANYRHMMILLITLQRLGHLWFVSTEISLCTYSLWASYDFPSKDRDGQIWLPPRAITRGQWMTWLYRKCDSPQTVGAIESLVQGVFLIIRGKFKWIWWYEVEYKYYPIHGVWPSHNM